MGYSEADRQKAVDLYIEAGAAEAARQIGCDPRTVRRWAKDAGVSADRDQVLTEGGERLAKQNEYNREQVRDLLLSKTMDLLLRIDEEHIEYKAAGSTMHTLRYETATSGDVRNYASAVKDLLNLYRLEMGESTSRSELVGDVDRELGVRLKEWERQLAAND